VKLPLARGAWSEKARAAVRFNRSLLVNAGSMMGTAVVTSGFGVVFWWLAAHYFSKDTVGVASASTSAMTLLGFMATLGFGTLLMGDLPRRRERRPHLVVATLIVSGLAGSFLGVGFGLIAPVVSSNFDPIRSDPLALAFFAAGVGLTALTYVLDQALIGLLRGGLQLSRNVVFSVVKLLVLVPVAALVTNAGPQWIYGAWTLGIAVSLVVLVRPYLRRASGRLRPDFGILSQMRTSALAHHLFNLAAKTPDLLVPVLVVALVSSAANASFYIAWMIAGFIFTVPWSLSTVVFAIGSGDSSGLAEKFRFSFRASTAFGVAANIVLLPTAGLLLGIFGPSYSAEATGPLHILALGVFGDTMRMHFIAVHRVQKRLGPALPIIWAGTVLELGAAAFGASAGGLTGVAIGWVGAVSLEGIVMSRDVLAAMRPGQVEPEDPALAEAETAAAIETMPVEPL
jgi:O-antigen/teichoic acid export membrane protein